MEAYPFSWTDVLDIPAVRAVSRLLARRFRVGVGFVAAHSADVKPPAAEHGLCQVIQTRSHGAAGCISTARQIVRQFVEQGPGPAQIFSCHAGLSEIGAPIILEGKVVGCLLTAAFVTREAAETSLVDVDRRTASLALAQAAYSDARAKVPTLAAKDVELLGDLLSTCCDEVTLELAEMMPSPRPLATRYRYDAIIGRGARIQELFLMLDKVIDSDATVMIQGENGTGKELIAKAIHVNSSRKNRRFVVQNCSAFNDNLLDSELFGHKRGAFTGAIADKQGLFEIADGGTFFLDEIGDMSPTLQVKLLRVLQEGTFLPVGDTMARKVDVRIIAATNRDLKTMVERGEFREDLFYRVNVINLLVPPLRDRKEDIPILVDHFLRKHGKGRLKTKRLTQDCLTRLLSHQWPGNVRELENEIERVVVLAGDEDLIGEELLSPRVRQGSGEAQQPSGLPEAVSALERKMIAEALRRHRGNKTRAAKDLRVSRRNLIRLVQKYELEEKGLRSGLKT